MYNIKKNYRIKNIKNNILIKDIKPKKEIF